MKSGNKISENRLPVSLVIPEKYLHQMKIFPPGLLLIAANGSEIYKRSLVQLAGWEKEDNDILSTHLDLRYQPVPRDHEGNVCFADDSGLRPEFRTWFHAAHLFDYYYALWQEISPSLSEPYGDCPLPSPRIFWTMASIGEQLRNIHLAGSSGGKASHLRSGAGRGGEIPVGHPFFKAENGKSSGRLFLNDTDYLEPVSAEAWEYRLGGKQILKEYLLSKSILKDSPEEVQRISDLADKLQATTEWQRGVKHTLDRIKST